MRPSLHEFRIYGSKNGLILDQNHEILLQLRGAKFKSYADNFIPPVLFAKQHLGNLLGNMRLFLARDFHMDSGMKYLNRILLPFDPRGHSRAHSLSRDSAHCQNHGRHL